MPARCNRWCSSSNSRARCCSTSRCFCSSSRCCCFATAIHHRSLNRCISNVRFQDAAEFLVSENAIALVVTSAPDSFVGPPLKALESSAASLLLSSSSSSSLTSLSLTLTLLLSLSSSFSSHAENSERCQRFLRCFGHGRSRDAPKRSRPFFQLSRSSVWLAGSSPGPSSGWSWRIPGKAFQVVCEDDPAAGGSTSAGNAADGES
mmetsp:Transcript_407/g.1040  ORF Transcript_407/g.1040 Transcript_407/m.1040 type:complete len:205 (+) Transcript_407:4217-4831(+)